MSAVETSGMWTGCHLGGHPAGEADPQRHAHHGLDLLLEPLRGAGHQRAAVFVDQEDRRGVDVEDVPDAGEQLVQQLFSGR